MSRGNIGRPSSNSRGYGHQWRRTRARYLARHPLCVYCEQAGLIREATVVDHIRPHRGDEFLFWDWFNLQSLCKSCHDGAKQAAENGDGVVRGGDVSGRPLDPAHPWNKETK